MGCDFEPVLLIIASVCSERASSNGQASDLLSERLRYGYKFRNGWRLDECENRLTLKYREGVDFFLEFSAKNADNPDLVHCPCLKCGNMEQWYRQEL
ncbi:hypothetical protein G4B88_008833 [Cannabis sativa]|uniref:Transposase-associated domain-containing protein n=1 Tax=Cannabis sativa TaxID=3483 RepID=A0A7J6FT89_CANSA|nr:hypothetical protein G4B88_008833 [Cannabis sativa]